VNFRTNSLKRLASEERSHAIEHFALEAFNIDLDDRRGRIASSEDGVRSELAHLDGGVL
jgi:hypothetical protein